MKLTELAQNKLPANSSVSRGKQDWHEECEPFFVPKGHNYVAVKHFYFSG